MAFNYFLGNDLMCSAVKFYSNEKRKVFTGLSAVL